MLTYIDTRQGTANQHNYSNGNTLPYTGVPFGMNHFVVQTTHERGSWFFHPRDRIFQGYRLTHQPSPWMGDFSHLLLTPVAGEMNMRYKDVYNTQSSYRPEDAVYKPHHLKIKQLRYGITSELAPTTYGAKLRIQYPKGELAGLFMRALGLADVTLSADGLEASANICNYTGCEDRDFTMHVQVNFSERAAYDSDKSLFTFQSDKVEVTLATSFISHSQASLNLSRDLPFTFRETVTNAAQAWEKYLGKVAVKDRDEEKLRTFYGCLYRMFLFPMKFYELDEQNAPIHYDTKSQTVRKGFLYTNNGFWDTFRTVYPFYSLIIPHEYEEMLEGFLNSYRETGYLPKWLSPDERGLMPGTLIDGLIADAASKGIGSHLLPELLEAMLAAATTQSDHPNYGRRGTADYLKYGYVPLDYHESVNHTTDYAYSDFCISQVAKILGNSEIADKYASQSLNYKNVFDKETGHMRAKDKEGNFRPGFKNTSWGLDYAEGSAYQNGFAVYHDFAGLITEYGGADKFLNKLIDLCNSEPKFDVKGYGFEIHEMSEMAAVDFGQMAISNQPSFHLPYLFNYAGAPAHAQVLLKQLMAHLFNSGFDGYPGDEDNGSMSGWYVFSALGFYPVTPGSGHYVLGIPFLDEATIQLGNGKSLTIETTGNVPQNSFVADLSLNGETYDKLEISHEDLVKGAHLAFRLGLVPPNKNYTAQQLPYSLSK